MNTNAALASGSIRSAINQHHNRVAAHGRADGNGLIGFSYSRRAEAFERFAAQHRHDTAYKRGIEWLRDYRARNPHPSVANRKSVNPVRLHEDAAGAASPSDGKLFARETDYLYEEVLLEHRAPLSAFELFAEDNRVPVGAEYHVISREFSTGQAAIYAGGSQIPTVDYGRREQRLPIEHVATSFTTDYFQMLVAGFAGLNELQSKMRSARIAIDEIVNDIMWKGDAATGLTGILTHPWLAQRMSPVKFDGTASADDMLAELLYIAKWSKITSKSAMTPDTLAVSPKVYALISETRMGSVDMVTVKEFFLRTNASGITDIRQANELENAGQNNRSGIFAYRRDPQRGVALVRVAPFSMLPTSSDGLVDRTVCYSTIGGAVMRDVGHQFLCWVVVDDT